MMSTTDFTHDQSLQGSNDTSASQKDGLEKLLALAEELHRDVDNRQRRIEKLRIVQVAGAIIQFLVMLYVIVYKGLPSGENVFAVVVYTTGAAQILLFPAMTEYHIRKARRRSAPDSAALTEVVQLLREVEPALTKAENWSYLDRVQFRIRLSRFGVGSST